MAFEHRIVHLAARQHVGQRVADQLADAQAARCERPARLSR